MDGTTAGQLRTARYRASGTLAARPPFDFARSLAFLGHFPPAQGEQILAGATLTSAFMVEGRPLICRVAAGAGDDPALRFTLHAAEPLAAATTRAAAERLAFFLSLDDDLREFYAIGAADPDFAPLLARLHGYHQVKFPAPFACACWALLSQRTPLAVARAQKAELARRYGAGLTVAGATHWAFPEAGQLLAADPGALLAIVRNGRRADYLRAAAAAFAAADESWLRAGPYDEVESWLRGIPGIGPWSATFILLRGLGRMERVPVGEAALGAAVARVYLKGQPATEAAVARRAAPYGPWRGYWAHYLRVGG